MRIFESVLVFGFRVFIDVQLTGGAVRDAPFSFPFQLHRPLHDASVMLATVLRSGLQSNFSEPRYIFTRTFVELCMNDIIMRSLTRLKTSERKAVNP